MNEQQEIIDLNVKRTKIQLDKLLSQLRPETKEQFKQFKIYTDDDTQISLNNIDFNQSCVFICPTDFLSLIGVYALQKINKVQYPDTSLQGTHSRIRTDYMIVDSPDIRYSKLNTTFEEGEIVPDMYNSTNYIHKQVCLWRLLKDVGQGDNKKMYDFCNERLYERYLRNQIDWCFFIGTLQEYRETYNIPLNIPVYIIKFNGKQTSSSKKDVW